MNKSKLLRSFNDHFDELFNYLNKVIPHDENISFMKSTLKKVKKVNASLIVQAWIPHVVVPYGQEILSGNYDYFLNKNFEEDVAKVQKSKHTTIDSSYVLEVIEDLKLKIKDMSEDDIQQSMKYLANLCQLSVLYNNCK